MPRRKYTISTTRRKFENYDNLIFMGIFMAAPHPPAIVQENMLQIWYPVILYHKIISDVFRASLNHLRFVDVYLN
jgi:hypothetical protein